MEQAKYDGALPQTIPELEIRFIYQEEKLCFDVCCDSDHAGDQTDRKSVTSFVCMLGARCLATHVNGQLVVALSSGEAEFYAMGSAASAGIYL